MNPKALSPLATVLVCAALACSTPPAGEALSGEVVYTELREPCLERNPMRNLYFGDLHFHTQYSWDAYGYHLKVTPQQSYTFARGGGTVWLPPLDSNGGGSRPARLERPLDFAAATDHAEFLGETHICKTPSEKGYDSVTCQDFRELGEVAVSAWGSELIVDSGSQRLVDLCGAEGERCTEAAAGIWEEIQQAAEESYDRSAACSFVTFVGYEYSATPKITNLHRNVIFRNAAVIDLPISYYEEPEAWGLWHQLDQQCLDGLGGCDVMVIPHNTNSSNGIMFHPDSMANDLGLEAQQATDLRARMEPIVEIFQHKGDMECTDGLPSTSWGEDPHCTFEKVRAPPLPTCGEGTGWGGMRDMGCVSRFDFLRGILPQGLSWKQAGEASANPYRVGVIGSTDSHNGTPGNTREKGFLGHVGSSDDTAEERLGEGNITHNGLTNNPGGLAAVWAVERSRDAIFEAMRRREVYSTSGTRIHVRFFGGWGGFDDGSCADADLVEQGYRRGVPMGSVLPPRADNEDPVFVLKASYDPGTTSAAGNLLQQAQIIKGWIDASGQHHEKVFVVAGKAKNGAGVDPETCAPTGSGGQQDLCAVWQDPEFAPSQRAFYYARVLENPSCRWSTWECNAIEADRRPPGCSDPRHQKVIQERAVTSAIWYEP